MKTLLFMLGILAMGYCQDKNSIDCSARGTCLGGRRNRLDIVMNWDKVNCMCDNECIKYGDCCPTANAYDPFKMKSAVTKYDCVNVFYTSSYYMKSSCQIDWEGPGIEELCYKASNNSVIGEDPLLSTPTTSLTSGVTYKNYFCALCNSEQQKDLQTWEVNVSCPVGKNDSSYIKDNLVFLEGSWGVYSEPNHFESCELYPTPNENIQHKVRQCKNYVSKCSSNWTDSSVAESCSTYTTMVYGPLELRDSIIGQGYFGSSMYRNYHCAKCNYIDDDSLACYERDFRQASFPTPVSFSILFDFGPKETFCEDGYLWDSFFQKCRLVKCVQENYSYQAGRCVKVSDSDYNMTESNNSTDKLQCEKIFFDQSEYTNGNNDSIVIVPYRRTYQSFEYELAGDGVFVCAPEKYSSLMGWLTMLGLGLSCVCLVIHIIIFCFVSDLRNLSGKNLVCLCLSLLIGYISFLVVTFQGNQKSGCIAVAYIMYYGFMASFAWMNVMAFDVWRTLRLATSQLRLTAGQQWRKFVIYSVYAWCLPVLLLSTIIMLDNWEFGIDQSYLPEMGTRYCWFGQPKAILVYFGAPLAVIMIVNIIFFSTAVRFIRLTAKSTNQISSNRPHQTQLKLYVRLTLLMGLSWSIGIFAGYFQKEAFWYAFILVNAFQGIFILMAFTCTDKVYKAISSMSKKRCSLNNAAKRHVLASQDSNTSQMNTSTSRLTSFSTPSKG